MRRKYPVAILVAAILTLMTTIAIAEGWNVLAFLGIEPDSDAQTLVQPVSVTASAGNVTLSIDSAITDGEYLAFDWTVENTKPETPVFIEIEQFTANGEHLWTDGNDDFNHLWFPGWSNEGSMQGGELIDLPDSITDDDLHVELVIGVYTPVKPVYHLYVGNPDYGKNIFDADLIRKKWAEGYYVIAGGDGFVIDDPEEGPVWAFSGVNEKTSANLARSEIAVHFELDLKDARASVRELPLPDSITKDGVTLTFLSATVTPLQTRLTAAVTCESGSKDTILHWAHRDEFVLTDTAGNELLLWDLCAQQLGETSNKQNADGSWFRRWDCTIIDLTPAMPTEIILSYRLDEQAHLDDGTPLKEGLRIDLPVTLK